MNKTDLLNTLNQLKPIITQKKSIDQTDQIVFKEDSIYASNGDMYVIKKFSSPILGSVKGIQFISLISKLKEEEIDIKVKKNKIYINNANTKIKLNIPSEDELILPFDLSNIIIEGWKELPKNFIEALKIVSFSASKDPSDGVLTQLLINKENVLSCDRFRLSKYKLDTKMDSFLLPSSTADKLTNYSITEYRVEENYIYFRGDDIYIACLRIIEEYPKTDHLFNIDGLQLEFPIESKNIIDNVNILATAEADEDRFINIIGDENKLCFKGEGLYGSIEETIETDKLNDTSFNIKVHPRHLKQILNLTNKVVIGDDKLLFVGNNFKHVLALVKEVE